MPRILLLIHGLKGDENVMWIFARRLPKTDWILAPRAIYPVTDGGYSWLLSGEGLQTPIEDYMPSVDRLVGLIDSIDLSPMPDKSRVDILGFSQGAAVALAFALAHPDRIHRVGCLAGFLPLKSERFIHNLPLTGRQIFMAHGTKDEQVPVGRARESAELLKLAGAEVMYCEDEVGHKVSATCMRKMESYFGRQ